MLITKKNNFGPLHFKNHDLFCSFVENMLIFFEIKLVNKEFSWLKEILMSKARNDDVL